RPSAEPTVGPYDGSVADFSSALPELDHHLTQIETVLDLPAKRAEIAELQSEVAAPDLWDDTDNAQRVTSRLSAVQGEVDRVTGLRQRIDDLGVLVELAEEEADDSSLAEAETELAALQK